jgi:hypothetical protein
MSVSVNRIRDSSWIRQAFLVDQASLDDLSQRNRIFTTARFKFMDTTPGGHIAINPPPQFCRNTDPRVHSIFTGDPKETSKKGKPVKSVGSRGMGRYWSEAHDDNMRIVTMRFGVPEFNSLTTFFTGFYNSSASSLARTGRSSSLMYKIGQVAGYAVTILALPLLIVNFFGNLWRVLDQRPASKYYYLKPTMPLYWNAVSSIVNSLAVNSGLIPRVLGPEGSASMKDGRYNYSKAELEEFAKLMPDMIMEGGGINIYAMSTRAQRLSRSMNKAMEERFKNVASNSEYARAVTAILSDGLTYSYDSSPSFLQYLDKWFASSASKPRTGGTDNGGASSKNDSPTEQVPTSKEGSDGLMGLVDQFTTFLSAEREDGSAFVSFRVDETGPVGENFSSQVAESQIASKINSTSSESRSTRFNFAGGNLGGGVIGDMATGLVSGVKDLVSGALDGVGASGLAALGGSAFVDIPQYWQNSTAQMPRMNYSFTLTSPYGNKMSILTNIYIPLAMILAGALPLSTGKQSYTSPFLVELYDRGRAQTRLGIIDSLDIQRGTGNLGFTASGSPIQVKVSFSVISLSSIMHMPIIQGYSTSLTGGLFDEDTTFSDYMNVLAGCTLAEQVYTGERMNLALTRKLQNIRTWYSSAHFAQFVGSWGITRLSSIFMTGAINR